MSLKNSPIFFPKISEDEMSREETPYYVFKTFRLDVDERQLLNNGEAIPLTPKAFDVLVHLVEHHGHLVEKEEIMHAVWPDSFVEEANVSRIIHTLRKSLGEDENGSKFIETISKKGYRFVAEVTRSDLPQAYAPENLIYTAVEEPRSTPSTRSKRPLWLVAAVGLIFLGGVLVFQRAGVFSGERQNNVSFDRLTQRKLTQAGNVYGPRISPDGQYLAYISIEKGEDALSLKQTSTGTILPVLPARPGVKYWAVSISPDNSFLYYILKEANADYGNLYRIPMLGGVPQKLVQFANGGLTLSPDGRQAAFVRIDRKANFSSIIVVNTDGTDERTISSFDQNSNYNSVAWSPDGKTIGYTMRHRGPNGNRWYIAEIPAEGGDEKRIGEEFDTKLIAAEWLPNRSGFILNAIDKATSQPQIYHVSYPEGTVRRLTNDLNYYYGLTVTADGRSVVASKMAVDRQIRVTPDGDPASSVQLTNGTEKHFDMVAWSRDNYLVFDEDQNSSFDRFNIWRMRPDGSDLQQLTFGDSNNTLPAVSPDGQTVAFVSKRSGKRQLWRMDIDGNNVIQLTDIAHDTFRPKFSPDGEKVFFSAGIGNIHAVWQVPINGGAPTPVVADDAYDYAVSPDGTRIAYATFDKVSERVQTRINSMATGQTEQILNIDPATWMDWSEDGTAIYYTTDEDERRNVWIQPLDGSKPRPVTDYKTGQTYAFAFANDAKKVASISQTLTYDAVMFYFE